MKKAHASVYEDTIIDKLKEPKRINTPNGV